MVCAVPGCAGWVDIAPTLVPNRRLPPLVEKLRLCFERARSIGTLAGYYEPAAVHESMPEAAGLAGGIGDLAGRCPDPPTGFAGGGFRPWYGWDLACFDSRQVGCVVIVGRAPAGASGCRCHVVMGRVASRDETARGNRVRGEVMSSS